MLIHGVQSLSSTLYVDSSSVAAKCRIVFQANLYPGNKRYYLVSVFYDGIMNML